MTTFERVESDIVVMGVGIGGGRDATNRLDTRRLGSCCVCSEQHRLDHQGFLENTVAEIAEREGGGRKGRGALRVGEPEAPQC